MLTETESLTSIGSNPPAQSQPLLVEFVPLGPGSSDRSDLPGLPVLPETLLLLELQLQESCVDLREMSQLVLADLGATMQILRLAGREYGNAEGRPVRIEDCISDLGLQACLTAVAAQPLTYDNHPRAIAETWSHSREIANYAKLVAEEVSDVNPEEAYLVGLLHNIGALPAVLGWGRRESGATDAAILGYKMARSWALPRCVTEFFCEVVIPSHAPRWSGIVRSAHERAVRAAVVCSFQNSIRPHLHRCG